MVPTRDRPPQSHACTSQGVKINSRQSGQLKSSTRPYSEIRETSGSLIGPSWIINPKFHGVPPFVLELSRVSLTQSYVLLPTSNWDHFSFLLPILQPSKKSEILPHSQEASNTVSSVLHRQGAPLPPPPIASSQPSGPAPRADFHNRAVGSASSHLLRSVNKSRSRLHFARLPSGASQTPARKLLGSGPPLRG